MTILHALKYLFVVIPIFIVSCAQEDADDTGELYDPTIEPVVTNDSSVVFDDATLATYELSVAPADWEWLNSNILLEEYVPADLHVGGHYMGEVGLRYKGSFGSLVLCLDDAGNQICPKLPMKIKFSEYDTEKRYYGLKRLNFHSLNYDPSLMNDRLGYDMYREMGVHAPRAVHAKLVINGEYIGLFSLVEQIDGRFTDNRWPENGDGNLYKEVWPESNDPAVYESQLKTNEGEADHSAIINFANAMQTTGDEQLPQSAATWVDMDYLLRYIAVDRAIANWDGIMAWYCDSSWDGCGNHNYYWYQEENQDKFWLIAWDLDNTFNIRTEFDDVPSWNELEVDCEERYGVFDSSEGARAPSCDPLIKALGLLGTDRYNAVLGELLNGPFVLETINEKIDRWAAQISEAVATDPNAPSPEQWAEALAAKKRNVELLHQKLENIYNNVQSPFCGLELDETRDFETCDGLGLALGGALFANRQSTVNFILNSNAPLNGVNDLRLDFTYRNEVPEVSWGVWSMLQYPFKDGEAMDLTAAGKTALTVTARAEGARSLRVDLGSMSYNNGSSGIAYGWTVMLSDVPQTFVLPFNEAAYPDWAASSPELTTAQLADILQQVHQVEFKIHPNGWTGDGLLSAPDTGYVQIDDVAFITQ